MDGIRSLVKSVVGTSWRVSMSGAEQITRFATRPITSLLKNQGGSLKSVATSAEQGIDSAFKTTAKAGDEIQQRTVDLMFDLLTLRPILETLEESSLVTGKGSGYQSQPELEFLQAMNDAGPAGINLIIIVAAVLYSNLNKEAEGIERFEKYIEEYSPGISSDQKAVYISLLGLLRISRSTKLPLWRIGELIGLIQRGLSEIKEAKELTANEPDPIAVPNNDELFQSPPGKVVARWISGLMNAQLPWPFGDTQVAIEDLKYCQRLVTSDRNMTRQLYIFLPEVYFQQARLYQAAGDEEQANRYLKLSGFTSFDSKILIASPYGVTPMGMRDGIQFVTETIPGKVFTVSGHDMSEFNFIITEDGKQLLAVDAGSRVDTAEAAYDYLKDYLKDRIPQLPELTAVFVTHVHWDHIGGHLCYRKLNPKVKVYSRASYAEEQVRSANQPPPYKWYMGATYNNESLKGYLPDVIVKEGDSKQSSAATEDHLRVPPPVICPPPVFSLEPEGQIVELPTSPSDSYPAYSAHLNLGGTRLEIILPPGGGGETPDGMQVYLPDYSVLYAGDFMVPWIGAPYIVEGDVPSLFATMELVYKHIKPKHGLHGHQAVTSFFGDYHILEQLKPHLEWLYCQTLGFIFDYKNRPAIQESNLIPPGITVQPYVQMPFLIMREVMIDRVYRQTVGYWGPQLQGVDYLSQREFGAALTHHFKLSEKELADGIKNMINTADYELAGEVVEWALTQYPDSEELKQVRRDAFLQLKQKWQQLQPFKFVMYSEVIGNPTPIAGNQPDGDS